MIRSKVDACFKDISLSHFLEWVSDSASTPHIFAGLEFMHFDNLISFSIQRLSYNKRQL